MVEERRLTMTAIGRSERRGPARMVKARLPEPQIPVSINRGLSGNLWMKPESPEFGCSVEPIKSHRAQAWPNGNLPRGTHSPRRKTKESNGAPKRAYHTHQRKFGIA